MHWCDEPLEPIDFCGHGTKIYCTVCRAAVPRLEIDYFAVYEIMWVDDDDR